MAESDDVGSVQADIQALSECPDVETDGYAIWGVTPNVPIQFGGWTFVFSGDLPRPYHLLVRRTTETEDLSQAERTRIWAEDEQRKRHDAEYRLLDLRSAVKRAVALLPPSVFVEGLEAAVEASYGDRT